MLAASRGRLCSRARSRSFAVLAVLMPIVAGMGGNAGTQTLAVAVRALATNQLTKSNTIRAFRREFTIALANGLSLGLLIGAGVGIIFHNPLLGAVIGAAMVINNLVAGLAGDHGSGHARPAEDRSGRLLRRVRDDLHRLPRLPVLPRPRDLCWPWALSHCES